jgi:hypothetical protein
MSPSILSASQLTSYRSGPAGNEQPSSNLRGKSRNSVALSRPPTRRSRAVLVMVLMWPHDQTTLARGRTTLTSCDSSCLALFRHPWHCRECRLRDIPNQGSNNETLLIEPPIFLARLETDLNARRVTFVQTRFVNKSDVLGSLTEK